MVLKRADDYGAEEVWMNGRVSRLPVSTNFARYLGAFRETGRDGPPEGSTRFGAFRARRAAASTAPPSWRGRGRGAIAAIPASLFRSAAAADRRVWNDLPLMQ